LHRGHIGDDRSSGAHNSTITDFHSRQDHGVRMERDVIADHGSSPDKNGGPDLAAATDLHIMPDRHMRGDHGIGSHLDIAGDRIGCVNLPKRQRAEPELAEKWKAIRLERPLLPATFALAGALGYECP
jgi:hypothetical protein